MESFEFQQDSFEISDVDPKVSLVAQLHYDRADVALISAAAARAMDIVIAMVSDSVWSEEELPTSPDN